jgi:hypothetical protein
MQALQTRPHHKEVSTRLLEFNFESSIVDFSNGTSTVFHSPALSGEIVKNWSKLLQFKRLGNNWDRYGALAPDEKTIDTAIDFLTKKVHDLNLPIYFVAPGVNGEVMLEFKGSEGKAAELYFNPDNGTELLLFQLDECVFEGTLENGLLKLIDFINN